MSRHRMLIGLLWTALLVPPARGEDPWAEVIRDAQTANKTLLAEGRATMSLEIQPDTQEDKVSQVQAEVSWRGPRLLSRVKIRDPEGWMTGEATPRSFDQIMWQPRLNDGRFLYVYNSNTHTLFIYAAQNSLHPLQELHPLKVWLACCPPGQGKPTSERVGRPPEYLARTPPRFEFTELDSHTVRERRFDPGGGLLESLYDLEQSGNKTKSQYIPAGGGPALSEAQYRWRKLGAASVLDGFDYFHLVPNRAGEMVKERISLRVTSVDLHGPPEEHFTKAHFLKGLPADTLIDDMVEGRRYRMNPSVRMREQDLRDLSTLLRSRGFLKK